jgi:hypothetical protein
VVRSDAVRAIGLEVGRIIRTVHPSRGVHEWVVASIEDRDGSGSDGLLRVRCAPIRALLGLRGLVRTITPHASPVVAFTPSAMTPAEAIETYILANADADGLSWLSVGVVESTEPMTLGAFSLATRGDVLAAIEETTRLRAVLRPLTNDAGYAIDLLRDPGATLDTVRLSLASGAAVVSRTRDVRRAPHGQRVRAPERRAPVERDG